MNLTSKQLDELHELSHLPEHEILVYYRQFLKASPNGRMTYSQFESQLKGFGASTNGSRAIFDMIDRDNSGQISFQEYLLSIVQFSQQSQPEQELGAVFDTYQAVARQQSRKSIHELNKQGMDRNDIERILKQIHSQLSERELNHLCDQYMSFDQNRNGYITKQEFIYACMKNTKLMEQLGHRDAAIKEEKDENDM